MYRGGNPVVRLLSIRARRVLLVAPASLLGARLVAERGGGVQFIVDGPINGVMDAETG